MIGALAWLLGSKVGRIVAVSALAVAMAGVILLSAFRRGQDAERSKSLERTLDNLMKKAASDEAVARMSPDARRERLRQWSRG